MRERTTQKYDYRLLIVSVAIMLSCLLISGCSGYSDATLYPQQVETVYVEMFENETFRRGIEYELSNAIAKRIEAKTPYKIVSSRNRADSVISGKIVLADEAVLSLERQTGRAAEKEVQLQAVVNWKDLKTGKLLIDNRAMSASASYSEWQGQFFDYASSLASNNLASNIVQQMEVQW